MLLNGGSYNQPHVATLKVVVHVPIKRYGMLWGFQSLHMNDGWMDGWYPSLKERKEGREGGRVPRVTIHNPKLHNSKEKPTWGDFPTPLGVGRRIGQPCSLSALQLLQNSRPFCGKRCHCQSGSLYIRRPYIPKSI